jgi:hypothetical protein
VDEVPYRPCVGCGYCCKKATCTLGLGSPCAYLAQHDGRYWCSLILIGAVTDEELAIGAGCCSSLNSDRQMILRNQTHPVEEPILKKT